MSLELNLVEFLVYFGALNTLILVFLLFFSRKNRGASRWLGLFILAIVINVFGHVFLSYLFYRYASFTLLQIPLLFAFGPLLWFYVQQLIDPAFTVRRKHLWYFAPFALDVLYTLTKAVYVWGYDVTNKLQYYHGDFAAFPQIAARSAGTRSDPARLERLRRGQA